MKVVQYGLLPRTCDDATCYALLPWYFLKQANEHFLLAWLTEQNRLRNETGTL